jgi:hypothetical protein
MIPFDPVIQIRVGSMNREMRKRIFSFQVFKEAFWLVMMVLVDTRNPFIKSLNGRGGVSCFEFHQMNVYRPSEFTAWCGV